MIRVLHVIDHLGLGGAQSALLDLAANMDPSQVVSEVAVLHGRGLFADQLESRGIKVHSLAPSKWPPLYVANFVRLLRAENYNVLHFHLQGANWLAKPLASVFSRAKRVAHDHSSADLRFRGWQSLPPDALAHLFSHRVIAVSQGVSDFLAAREFVPRNKITVVPNGVDTRVFHPPTSEQRSAARTALGLAADKHVIGALGRLAPEKNFASLAKLARIMPDVEFVVGGTGPERAAIFEAAGGAKNFHLPGEISDRCAFYAALDAFVLPSRHEALPMTVLEAMASGVPVAASDLEGVAAAIGDAGVLFPAENFSSLENAVRSLIGDPDKAERLAVAARERVKAHYDARGTASKVTGIYREFPTR
jgi:glycosyltransferase involved in cell wall biosynthesis